MASPQDSAGNASTDTLPDPLLTKIKAFLKGQLDLPALKIKENRVRTVWRLDIPGERPLLVKHYRYIKLFDRIRYRFIKDKAQKEAANIIRLTKAGIPVPRVLAWERMSRNEALFVGEFLDQAVTWSKPPDLAQVQALARAIKALHAEKFLHRDLHLGNVLVLGDTIYLIDFHRGWFLPLLPAAAEIRMLGMVAHSFIKLGQEEWIEPFLTAYRGGADPAFQAKVMAAVRKQAAVRLLSRSKRCTVNSTTFSVTPTDRGKVYKRRPLTDAQLDELCTQPGDRITQSPKGDVVLLENGGQLWCRKTVRYGLFRGALTRLIPPRLWLAWRAGNALMVRLFPVAVPYAYIRRTRFGCLREEVLITEGLAGFQTLPDLLASYWHEGGAPALNGLIKTIMPPLCRWLEQFHETRFWQHDMAPKNIMAMETREGWTFRLIDLDNVKRSGLNRRRILRNLVQLGNMPGVSIRWLDLARFVRDYQRGAYWQAGTVHQLKTELLKEMLKRIVRENRFFSEVETGQQ